MGRVNRLSGMGSLFPPERWEELLRLGSVCTYRPGRILMRQGDEGHMVLVLVHGRVKVSVLEPDGAELPVAVRHRGEVLGDIAVLDKKPRTATIEAIDFCTVRMVTGARFERFVADHALSALVLRHSLGRLREAEERRAEMAVCPLAQRLCRTLLRLSTEDGSGGAVLDLHMSQQDLGRMIGASRNAIVLVLRRLRELGVVDTSRQCMLIHDVPRLRKYAENGIPGAPQER